MHRKKKRHFTLIEIMVVVALIGIIGGVLSYNLKGSLEKGKAFKTVESKRQIKDILHLSSTEQGIDIEETILHWEEVLESSPLVHKADKLKRDGWNELFELSYQEGEIIIQSRKLQDYYRKHNIIPDPDDEPYL